MLVRFLLIASIAAGALIGLLWPRESAKSAADQMSQTVISRSSDGQYYADVEIKNKSLRFLVDTGSSEVALTEADAKRLGITIDPDKYQLIGDGASGLVRGQPIEIGSLKVGPITQTDVKAVVVQGASVSLLGQPFLDKIDAITIRDGEMTLANAQPS